MKAVLIALMIIAGVLFIGAVLLMSPKGGLGFGLGGAAGSNEYGSKKSVESTLKKVAYITGIIFLVCVAILPYIK